MQSKYLIFALVCSLLLISSVFSQCGSVESSNDENNAYYGDEAVADSAMQGSDTGLQGSDTVQTPPGNDTGTINNDTTNQDTSNQNQNDSTDGSGANTPKFDPNTVDSFPGHVLSIDTLQSSGAQKDLQLSVKTKKGDSVTVYLAPESFLKDLNFSVKKNDSLLVIGSEVQSQGKSLILASKVIKDNATYLLRDDKGVPFWPNYKEENNNEE